MLTKQQILDNDLYKDFLYHHRIGNAREVNGKNFWFPEYFFEVTEAYEKRFGTIEKRISLIDVMSRLSDSKCSP